MPAIVEGIGVNFTTWGHALYADIGDGIRCCIVREPRAVLGGTRAGGAVLMRAGPSPVGESATGYTI